MALGMQTEERAQESPESGAHAKDPVPACTVGLRPYSLARGAPGFLGRARGAGGEGRAGAGRSFAPPRPPSELPAGW